MEQIGEGEGLLTGWKGGAFCFSGQSLRPYQLGVDGRSGQSISQYVRVTGQRAATVRLVFSLFWWAPLQHYQQYEYEYPRDLSLLACFLFPSYFYFADSISAYLNCFQTKYCCNLFWNMKNSNFLNYLNFLQQRMMVLKLRFASLFQQYRQVVPYVRI